MYYMYPHIFRYYTILIISGCFQFITKFILYVHTTSHSEILPITHGGTQSYSHVQI